MARRAPLLLAACLALAACSDDGRALAPAPEVPVSPETTSTTVAEPAVTPEAPVIDDGADGELALTSTAFADGEAIDATFTCDGLNVPPPLTITGVPEEAVELGIAVIDPDADGFVHWALAGLDPATTSLESGTPPPGAVVGLTSSGIEGWDGPCPPEGDDAHEYVFAVYAFSEPPGMQPEMRGTDAVERFEERAIRADTLVGTYRRTDG